MFVSRDDQLIVSYGISDETKQIKIINGYMEIFHSLCQALLLVLFTTLLTSTSQPAMVVQKVVQIFYESS